MAPQSLGAQLDRCQRILDFVREPPRHLAPRRDLLRANERRHIVEDQHDALRRAAVADERGGDRRKMQLLTFARNRDFLRGRLGLAAAGPGQQRAERLQIGTAEDAERRLADDRSLDAQEPRRRAVDRRDPAGRVHRHDARRDALQNRLDVAPPPFDLLVFPFELDGRSLDLAPARLELDRHRVECVDERAELVVALRLDPLIEMARADLARGRRQKLHGARDALRQIRSHPCRAEQNQQRDHQEERQVHAGERLLEHSHLLIILERLRHAARARGQIARQKVSRDDDAGRLPGSGSDRRRGMQQNAGGAERLDESRLARSGEYLGGEAIRGGTRVARRQRRRGDVDHGLDLRQRSGRRPIHLHHLHALQRDFGREEVANRTHVGARERHRRQRPRDPRRVIGDLHLPLLVIVGGNLVRRAENLVHRRVEPSVDAAADQLAADDEHEDGGHERHREEQRDELRAEPGERQPATPLDDQLDDVAAEQPDEDDENREVRGRQRVQDELAEEVGRQPRRAVGNREDRDEDRDEQQDPREDQARIVAEGTAGRLRRRPRRRGLAFRGQRRDGGRHTYSDFFFLIP